MRRARALIGVVFAVATSCTYADQAGPYRPPGIEDHEIRSGEEIYKRDCAFCHGTRGAGTDSGPDLISERNGPALTDFMLRTGRMPIDEPDDPIVGGRPHLDEREIEAVVDYVSSFGGEGPAVPDPHPERGDVSQGMRFYQDSCAACHSTTGIGGTLTEGAQSDLSGAVARRSGVAVPSVLGSTPLEIAEAIRTGPGTMPPFSEETFDDAEVDAIVAYIEHMKDEDVDRGGASIGRIGPVAEGAVALLVGLVALVLFTRWIGSTR